MKRRVQAHSRRRARRGLALWRAGLFLALALALTALLAEHPASAQTPSTLISNTAARTEVGYTGFVTAQGFETGDNAGGYVIQTIEIPLNDADADRFAISLWNADANGLPTSRHTADFAPPTSFVASNLVFTAPVGTILDPSSKYAVVLRPPALSELIPRLQTLSDAEDAGGAAGWSIDDTFSVFNDGTWTTSSSLNRSLVIAIKGQAVNALVGNLGVTPEITDSVNSARSLSQVFTSGGNYMLTSIEIISRDADDPPLGVSLWTVQSGLPHEKRADLIAPASFPAGTLVFTAPPDTRISGPLGLYAVVVTSNSNSGSAVRVANSEDEDAGKATGFAIADRIGINTGTSWGLLTSTHALKMRVNGVPGHAPGAPSGLGAAYRGEGKVALSWTAGAAGTQATTGYRVEVSTDGGASWSDAAGNTNSTATSYTHDLGYPPPYGDLRYRVSAISSLGMSPPSGAASATTDPLALVSNLQQTGSRTNFVGTGSQSFVSGGQYTVTDIQVDAGGSGSFTASIWTVDSSRLPLTKVVDLVSPSSFSAGTLTFTVPGGGLKVGRLGVYAVVFGFGSGRSIGVTSLDTEDSGAESGWSIENAYGFLSGSWSATNSGVSLKIAVRGYQGHAPGKPTALKAQATGPSHIQLSWTAPATTGTTAISGYRIEVSTDGSTWRELVENTNSTDTTYAHTGLSAGDTRHYRVQAINGSGPGPASDTATDTADALISNTGQETSGGTVVNDLYFSQGFTTGDNAQGYTLSAIEMISADAEGDDFTANLYATDADGRPTGNSLASLTAPTGTGAFAAGRVRFTAPANTTLTADTTYAVVVTRAGTGSVGLVRHTENDEDSGHASNWSIADAYSLATSLTGTWEFSSSGYSLSMTVRGQELPPLAPTGLTATATADTQIDLSWTPPAGGSITGYKIEVSTDGSTWTDLVADTGSTATTYAHTGLTRGDTRHYRVSAINSAGPGAASAVATETTDVLVANIRQGTTAAGFATADFAQAFRTGANEAGYTLTAVEIASGDADGDAFTAKLYRADGRGLPTGISLVALSPPTGAGAFSAGRVRFTAPANTLLSANTDYVVVVTTIGSEPLALLYTGSNSEDPGKASGFSIGDSFAFTEDIGSSSWSFSRAGASMAIAVRGSVNSAPRFASAALSRYLVQTSVAGQNVGAAVSAMDADGDTLAYTLGGADAASFDIVSTSGQVQTKAGVTYDVETKSTYTVTVTASDGKGGTATVTVTVRITLTDLTVEGGSDLPNTADTWGEVRVDEVSEGSLDPPFDGDRRGDVWQLVLTEGRRYRVELEFDGDPTADRGGVLWLLAPTGYGGLTQRVCPAGCFPSLFAEDYVYDDGRAFVEFGYFESADETGGWRSNYTNIRTRTLFVRVAPWSRLRLPLRYPHFGGYELTLSDVTGTVPMVGNLGRDHGGSLVVSGSGARAQRFTTGHHGHGFSLDRLEAFVSGVANGSVPRAAIHGDHSDAPAGEPLCTLVSPLAYRHWDILPASFRAPSGGCDLEAGTRYWAVFSETGDAEGARYEVDYAATADADARDPVLPAEWGWDGDAYHFDPDTNDWQDTTGARALQFQIIARPKQSSGGQGAPGNDPPTGAPTITGTAQVGETLSATTATIEDDDGLEGATFAYEWLRSGVAIEGATGERYTLVEADAGSRLYVRVTFTDDGGNEESLTSEPTDTVVFPPLRLESATVEGADLKLTYSHPLNATTELLETAFSVTVGGTAATVSEASASGSVVTLVLATGVAAGDTVTVGYEKPETDNRNHVVLDAMGRPAENFSGRSVTNDTAAAGLTASVRNAPASHDGSASFTLELHFSEAPTLSYVALRDHAFNVTGGSIEQVRRLTPGSNLGWEITVAPSGSGAVTLTLAATTDCEDEGAVCTGDGKQLTVAPRVSVPGPASQQQRQQNNPATGAPAIGGTAQVGETLTASTTGITDADGLGNATFTYAWLADGVAIAGAAGSSYTLTAAEEGKAITVRVSFTDDAGNAESLTSAATSTVAARPNRAATGAPAIRGTAQVGETLTASTSGIVDADGLTNATFTYGWLADGVAIAGATGSSYTLTAAEEGKAITVVVTFTDDAGNAESLTSAATSAVAPAPLTAEVREAPESHDGSGAFTFELHFSEAPSLSFVALRDHAFSVTGGGIERARRLTQGSNQGWEITVRPSGSGAVTLTLPVTTDCEAEGAVCTAGGKMLSERLETVIPGP